MIFLTGATGFVGRHVVADALARGLSIRCLVRNRAGIGPDWPAAAEIHEGDLLDEGRIRSGMSGCTAVVHLAAAIRAPRETLWRTNVTGTAGLCAEAERAGIRRFVFLSSLQANGAFDTEYGRSKREAERIVELANLDWTIFRPTQIYGPGDLTGLTRVAQSIGRALVVPVPAGGRVRIQPVSVGDVVRAMLTALDRPAAIRRRYDLAGPDAVSLADFVACAARLQQRRILRLPVPVSLIRVAARLAGSVSAAGRDALRTLTMDKVASIAEAQTELDYAPTPLSAGLARALGLPETAPA